MKKLKSLLLACALLIGRLYAQTAAPDEVFHLSAVKLVPNTIGAATLSVDLKIGLSNGTISPDYYIPAANRPKFHIAYNGKQPACAVTGKPAVTKNSIQVILSNLSQESVERIAAKDNKITVQFDEDLVFQYRDNSLNPAPLKTGRVSKTEINQKLAADLSFPEDEKTSFITALNNFYYYQNNIDFGVQPAKDPAPLSYTLNFNFQNVYSSASLLQCPDSGQTKKPGHSLLYYGISSRLSTYAKDSLNFINIYPLILRGSNYTGKLPTEWQLKAGHESSQDFSNRRFVLDAALSAIMPNLVNLTSGNSTRLRLKPVIDLGIKGYYDYSRNRSAFTSGQAYLNLYYYIPVYDHYAIILNDKTFYDFSVKNNPKKQFASNYSVAVGTEIPKTGFKVMFKYQDGKSEFNQKTTQTVVIGLIMNMFNEKAGGN
jgi:hypothetical protein